MRSIKLEIGHKQALKKAEGYFQTIAKIYSERVTKWAFRKVAQDLSTKEKLLRREAELEKELANLGK